MLQGWAGNGAVGKTDEVRMDTAIFPLQAVVPLETWMILPGRNKDDLFPCGVDHSTRMECLLFLSILSRLFPSISPNIQSCRKVGTEQWSCTPILDKCYPLWQGYLVQPE